MFVYLAKDKKGKTIKGELAVENKAQALDVLRQRGLFVIKLTEKKESSGFSFSPRKKKDAKVKLEELVLFSRQLATLVGSGITIVSALDALSLQVTEPGFKKALTDIRESVSTGLSLSKALGKYGNIFSPYFVNMVKAGESSGNLDTVLERVAEYLEKTSSLQKKIKSAMVYPVIVSIMAVLVTFVMLVTIVPVFEDMFRSFDAALPMPTQMLINVSDFVRSYFIFILIFVTGLVFVVRKISRTEAGHYKIDQIKLRVPIFGDLTRKVSISKITRTLGTLVDSGVPILTALDIVAKTAGNDVVEEAIGTVRASVQKGESIAGPMEKSGVFPPMVTRMVSVGEKSGKLDSILDKISDFYDDQVDSVVEGLTSIIEPVVIAFLGVVIGGIVIAMFLPIFQLTTVVGF